MKLPSKYLCICLYRQKKIYCQPESESPSLMSKAMNSDTYKLFNVLKISDYECLWLGEHYEQGAEELRP